MNALRSELIKLSSLRSSLIYFILLTGSLYGPIVLQGLLDSTMDMSLTWTALLSGGIIFQVLAVIYGAFSASSDLNNRLHGQAFLTQPNRWNWLVAKMAVTAGFTVFSLVVGLALGIAAGFAFGMNTELTQGLSALWTALLGYPGFAVAAVGIAVIVRSQVAAIGLPLIWIAVLEGLIQEAGRRFESVEKLVFFLPNSALDNLLYSDSELFDGAAIYPEVASGTAAVAVLIGWLAVLVAGGLISNQRRDVR